MGIFYKLLESLLLLLPSELVLKIFNYVPPSKLCELGLKLEDVGTFIQLNLSHFKGKEWILCHETLFEYHILNNTQTLYDTLNAKTIVKMGGSQDLKTNSLHLLCKKFNSIKLLVRNEKFQKLFKDTNKLLAKILKHYNSTNLVDRSKEEKKKMDLHLLEMLHFYFQYQDFYLDRDLLNIAAILNNLEGARFLLKNTTIGDAEYAANAAYFRRSNNKVVNYLRHQQQLRSKLDHTIITSDFEEFLEYYNEVDRYNPLAYSEVKLLKNVEFINFILHKIKASSFSKINFLVNNIIAAGLQQANFEILEFYLLDCNFDFLDDEIFSDISRNVKNNKIFLIKQELFVRKDVIEAVLSLTANYNFFFQTVQIFDETFGIPFWNLVDELALCSTSMHTIFNK
ncbi:hypothetical protein HDU92_001027 [Lobulomyces angularis]|nr:hypothetical protein HDU92_001027 [Lobulomyces angularis]